jgi:hypothetical protein
MKFVCRMIYGLSSILSAFSYEKYMNCESNRFVESIIKLILK